MGGGFLMGAFLGPVGGLERVASPTSEPVEEGPRYVTQTAMSGRKTAQRLPRQKRVWTCTEGTIRPEDAAILEWLAAGGGYDQSNGYVWYPSYSLVTNMLTPAEAFMEDGAWTGGDPGGGGNAEDARYLASETGDEGSAFELARPFPVPASSPVAVSAYVSTHLAQTARLEVTELDPEGATIGPPHVSTVPADTHALRAAVTFTSSVRTVALRIRVVGALMRTMPAITLTREVQPWASGRGCAHAFVMLTGEDPQLAAETPTNWARRHGRTFTIQELG